MPLTEGYTFQPLDSDEQDRLYQEAAASLGSIQSGHYNKDKWYRKYRRWSQYYREIAQREMGLAGYDPLDPVAQLGRQLQQQYTGNVFEALPMEQLLQTQRVREMALRHALRQQSAGMGMVGLYGGLEESMQRMQNTLASQAYTAYLPMQQQAQSQADMELQDMLNRIAQTEQQTEAYVATAGLAHG